VSQWEVVRAKGDRVVVDAEYAQISDVGALCFMVRDKHTAMVVHAFSPGNWVEALRLPVPL
jgi:hypothetical protein